MDTHLLQVRTEDHWLLDGTLSFPQVSKLNPQPDRGAVDGWLLVHGTGGNFYSRGVLADFAQTLVEAGYAVMRINTRGHDYIAGHAPPPARGFGGAAFESLGDCSHDLAAWIDEFARRGLRRIVLVGHSLGGVKAIYSQACAAHPNVVAVIAVSPPRFCHAVWQASAKARAFREHFQRATEMIASGHGDELICVQQPLPMWLTAAGFVAKYGPHDEFDIVRLLPKGSVPVLMILGTDSVARSPAFETTPAAIANLPQTNSRIDLQLVAGADVGYSGQTDVPPRLALAWIESVLK